MSRAFLKLMISISFVLLAGQSFAASGPWQGSDIFQARLVTATDHVSAEKTLSAGLEVKLQEGWKIYWRSPGDAGLPPELDFSSSKEVADHHIDFPAPYRFSVLGFDSYGYKDHVILPVTITLNDISRNIVLAAVFTGLVCDDVCIPVDETLTISLPYKKNTAFIPSQEAREIARFASRVPRASTSAGVSLADLNVTGDKLHIRFQNNNEPAIFRGGDVFIEGPTGYSFAKPEIHPEHISLTISGSDPALLEGQQITVTAVTSSWLLEEAGVISQITSNPQSRLTAGLLSMLFIAFLGGVILNIMPCVLPVISLKLAQVIGMGGQDNRAIRMSFLATAAGIITSFILLGVSLYLLRQAGVAIGWGIQFQNLYFLGFASAAIALFALIMLDVITIPVPQGFAALGRDKRGYVGDFITGFMATILATPCSAPFVGTALTFALTAPAEVLLLMFFAMGVGLAMPWLMVAGRPSLAAKLPRPGPWLTTLKRVLSLGLFATTAWLVSIMVTISGDDVVIEGKWQAWATGQAETLAQEGSVVFVDVTAAWCLTCKANKALVLDTDEMAKTFTDHQVKLLRADWTKPNSEISDFLAKHDRFGIPFNIVYGPSAPAGIKLPELLTIDLVKDAVLKAQE